MKSVALVTYSELPKLSESDQFLIEPLEKEGFKPYTVAWDDNKVNWEKFDFIILRSCWNYHYKINEFLAWLDKLEKIDAQVWNPLPIVRWNINKRYLLDLEKQGISIVPTVILNKSSRNNLKEILKEKGWGGKQLSNQQLVPQPIRFSK